MYFDINTCHWYAGGSVDVVLVVSGGVVAATASTAPRQIESTDDGVGVKGGGGVGVKDGGGLCAEGVSGGVVYVNGISFLSDLCYCFQRYLPSII